MILSILSIAISVAILIAVHEIGHLIAAKACGIGVERFSIGFGPTIIQKKVGETTYGLSLIPLGGFVKMVGEDYDQEGFYTASARKKILVSVIGPAANLLLGFVLSIVIYTIFGQAYFKPVVSVVSGSDAARAGVHTGDLIRKVNGRPVASFEEVDDILSRNANRSVALELDRGGARIESRIVVRPDSLGLSAFVKPVLGGVNPATPAYHAGLRRGDEILELDGKPVSTWPDLVAVIQQSAGKKITLRWRRGPEVITGSVVPVANQTGDKTVGQIGISPTLERKRVGFFRAVGYSAVRTIEITGQTFAVLFKLVVGKISGRALAGPIGIAQLSVQTIQLGAEYFLSLLVLLSINLFVINLLPIPVLDGGRVVIFLLEAIRRKRLSKKQWNIVLQAGWAVIILIFVFVTFNDILRIVKR